MLLMILHIFKCKIKGIYKYSSAGIETFNNTQERSFNIPA